MNTDPDSDLDPTRESVSRGSSALSALFPILIIGILGCINGWSAWPAFRQQDTSLLHWILVSNSNALRGLSKATESEGTNPLMKPLRDYLTLENLNLSGLDLSSSDLGDMSIENVNLAGARLVNSKFSCTDLTNVNLNGARLMHSRFDYSSCEDHVSTQRLHCNKKNLADVMNTKWPYSRRPERGKIRCLEGSFVGSDFSNAQIRGDQGRRSIGHGDPYCNKLLVMVGDMSGAIFNEAKLTCVALINRRPGSARSDGQSDSLSTNGISFADARLDRVALLQGPFRFTQFERAQLMGLFLNINKNQVDLDYSRFNEIKCNAPALNRSSDIQSTPNNPPCLLVQQDQRVDPLRLNVLWSTLVTNLEPLNQGDRFICTPQEDLPAWVGEKPIESAGFWVLPIDQPNTKPKQLKCPGDLSGSKSHHLLEPATLGSNEQAQVPSR